MKELLYFLSLSIFILYISIIVFKYGLQESISDSYYVLNNNHKFIFTLFIWFTIIPLMLILPKPFLLLSGVCISFVGASPNFKVEFEKKVHFSSAITGIVFFILSMYFDFKELFLSLFTVSFIIVMYLFKIKNKVWWIEILCFLLIYYNILKNFNFFQ